MTTYYFNGQVTPAGIPWRGPNQAAIQVKIDVPSLIANGGLTDSSGNALSVPSTGFSDEDIIKIPVNAGTMIRANGLAVQVTTAEGGACTCKIGCQTASQIHTGVADDDGWMVDVNLNSVGYDMTAHDDGFGSDNFNGILFITDGYIDIEFNTDLTAVTVFKVSADAVEMFNAANT